MKKQLWKRCCEESRKSFGETVVAFENTYEHTPLLFTLQLRVCSDSQLYYFKHYILSLLSIVIVKFVTVIQ